MVSDKGILIKNIYYMLTYAFRVLRQSNYEEVEAEEFSEIQDMFAAILSKGVSQQLKQGLYKEYLSRSESLPVLRGKLDFDNTMQLKVQRKQLLHCEYDELSENNIFNRILKTTMTILINSSTVRSERKKELRKILLFFHSIEEIDPIMIKWNRLKFQKNNQNYQMLMNICFFVLDGLLQTTDKGTYRLAEFKEDNMAKLFERFVLEYYRYHHGHLNPNASQVRWDLDEGADDRAIRFLPTMQTDITLRYGDQTLIIDTKYYGKSMQTQYEKEKVHSNNLYQIFTYVKNLDARRTGKVSGLLLYAKTRERITPDFEFPMGGNTIGVKTLDMNHDFSMISNQLDRIVESSFEIGLKVEDV